MGVILVTKREVVNRCQVSGVRIVKADTRHLTPKISGQKRFTET